MTFLLILLSLCAILLLLSLVCFLLAFYAPRKKPPAEDEYPLPEGKIYEPYHDLMAYWMKKSRQMPHKDVTVTSFDGLTLCGRYYEYAPGAPMELMFHGYRGSGERDLCVGIQRAFSLGRNVLIVEQRTSCGSEGRVITFGIRESRDCLTWIDFAIETFGADVTILLTGISMGATTVLLAAGHPLPPNVKGILADCGFTSAREIICKILRQIHLSAPLFYPLIALGARLWGGFRLSESDALQALQRCTVPVIFIHGESDDFVPCDMSRKNYDACPTPKAILTVPGAGHGLAYVVDPERYRNALCSFFTEHGVPTDVIKNSSIPEITA